MNKRPLPVKGITLELPVAGKRAFTLVELLVVIGIIAVLIAILLPTIASARRQANTTACAATMRGLGQALSMYAGEYKTYPWAAYYSAAGVSDTNGGDGSDSPIDQVSYIWWSVIRGYMRGHGAPINNVVTASNGQPLTRFMEAFACPTASNRNAGCDFVCNGVIMPWQITEVFDNAVKHSKNAAISKPCKPSGVYPDDILLYDATELPPNFDRQYVTSFDLDSHDPDDPSYTKGTFSQPRKPTYRYRGLGNYGSNPALGDNFPIDPGPNQDSGVSNARGNIRWRHGRNDRANFLFADGSVKTMRITVGYGNPNVQGEVLRKYFRPKPPPGYDLRDQ